MSLRRTKLNVPLIQLPSVERDWLIADPSLSLSPVAPVDSALSLLKQQRNITMKNISLPLTKGHNWVSNRWHCQSHKTRARGKTKISPKFQRNKHCTDCFENGYTLFCTMQLLRCKLQGERAILALLFTLSGLLHVTNSLELATHSRRPEGWYSVLEDVTRVKAVPNSSLLLPSGWLPTGTWVSDMNIKQQNKTQTHRNKYYLTNWWLRSLPSGKIHQVHYRSFSHHLAGFIFSFLNEVYSDDSVCTATEIKK